MFTSVLEYLSGALLVVLFAGHIVFHILMTHDQPGIWQLRLMFQPKLLSERGRWYRRMSLICLALLVGLALIGAAVGSLLGLTH